MYPSFVGLTATLDVVMDSTDLVAVSLLVATDCTAVLGPQLVPMQPVVASRGKLETQTC